MPTPPPTSPVLLLVVAMVVAAAATGCGTLTVAHEPLRILNPVSLTARDLGATRGRTRAAEVVRAMQQQHLTGIVRDVFSNERTTVTVVGADYQDVVHVFVDDRYDASIPLHHGRVIPYGFALRVAESAGRIYLLVLYRDPLEQTSERARAAAPRIELYVREEGGFRYLRRLRLGQVSRAHGGMTRPLFVGFNLDDGVLLLARDLAGAIWGEGYFVRLQPGGDLALQRVTLDEASRCSCVQRYMANESYETLWDEVEAVQ